MMFDYTGINFTDMTFDWTTGFELDTKAYSVEVKEDKVELMIPVFNASKKDIKITHNVRWYNNLLIIEIPDTILSDSRKLEFGLAEEYEPRKAKANVRDGILYVYIPLKEKSKPSRIEIT
jgi:HSP20 family molecular chaperone IbpA